LTAFLRPQVGLSAAAVWACSMDGSVQFCVPSMTDYGAVAALQSSSVSIISEAQFFKNELVKGHGTLVYQWEDENMTDQELHLKMGKLASQEREILSEVVTCVYEMERKKCYARLGFSSMFAYLTEVHHYSNGSAQRRIDAARMMAFDSLVVQQGLRTGELTLKHISTVAVAVRERKRSKGIETPPKQIMELLEIVQKCNEAKTEGLVAQALDLKVRTDEKRRVQGDQSLRVEFTLSPEEVELIQKAKEAFSHVHPDLGIKDLLLALAKKATSTVETKSPKVRRHILNRDQYCQWPNPITGKVCGSRHQLQIDHIHPRWLGGQDDPANLQVLCRTHNLEKYKQEAKAWEGS